MIINKDNLKKYALNYLNRYASSKKNLVKILSRKLIKSDCYNQDNKINIKNIILELERDGILNDENFANSVAFSGARIGKSKRLIKYNLLKKGISNYDINNALNKLENEIPDYETQSAINFARKKKLGKFGNSKDKNKDLAKMLRAGFDYEIIKKILYS